MGGTVDGVALPKEVLDAAIPLRVIEVRVCCLLLGSVIGLGSATCSGGGLRTMVVRRCALIPVPSQQHATKGVRGWLASPVSATCGRGAHVTLHIVTLRCWHVSFAPSCGHAPAGAPSPQAHVLPADVPLRAKTVITNVVRLFPHLLPVHSATSCQTAITSPT